MQLLVSAVCSQAMPPCMTRVTMDRERERLPSPHSLEQVPQALQPESTQSTGQAWVLQLRDSEPGPQAIPPKFWEVTTERWRVLWPLPQLMSQVPQLLHVDNAQSIGQGRVPHVCVSTNDGQAKPL